MTQRVNPITAEAKAVYEGSKARYQDDGSFLVACRHPEVCGTKSHRITLEGLAYADGSIAIRFRCDCPSGAARPSNEVPCYHAAACGRRLERQRMAVWASGVWYAHGRLHEALELGDRAAEAVDRENASPFNTEWEIEGRVIEATERFKAGRS